MQKDPLKSAVEPKIPHAGRRSEAAAGAKLLVVLLAFAWGLNWIAAAIALHELTPWSLRCVGTSIGVVTLFAAAYVTGHNMRVPRGEYIHVMIPGFLNVAAFPNPFRLRANEWRNFARNHHHLFNAHLGDVDEFLCARRKAEPGAHRCTWLVHRRTDDPGVAAVRHRVPALRALLARLRAELGGRHRLHQVGQAHDRAAGERGVAIGVRACVHFCRHVRLRGLATRLAAQ